MGRKPTGYTRRLEVFVRPEVGRALEGLARTTRLSMNHITRAALEQYLTDLGLLDEKALVQTPPAGPTINNKEKVQCLR